jgi:precorrin-8X/cobalt-precorrin-8 methylmutase
MENILIIGHGSPKKDANTIEAVGSLLHRTIHPHCAARCVRVAYMQYGEPGIMESIRECVEGGASKITIHPFFLSSGMHVTKDIPRKIEEARQAYPHVEFVYTEPLGPHGKLIEIVVERINASGIAAPADIEKKSFDIISGEVDLSHLPSQQIPIVKRVIHATADFEFAETLIFSHDAIKTGLDAIKAGMDIITDVEMVKAGINKRLLGPWGGKVVCAISDEEVARISAETGETRAAISIERGLRGRAGIIAIGNAPTALLKTIETLVKGPREGFTPLVVGVPVGFVKALESKTLLSAEPLPFITNLSRKGGTPVAVAIVNALLKMASEGV